MWTYLGGEEHNILNDLHKHIDPFVFSYSLQLSPLGRQVWKHNMSCYNLLKFPSEEQVNRLPMWGKYT